MLKNQIVLNRRGLVFQSGHWQCEYIELFNVQEVKDVSEKIAVTITQTFGNIGEIEVMLSPDLVSYVITE